MEKYDLSRFTLAHRRDYETALSEIQNGHKESHWIWYIFPQLKGLGFSTTSAYYGIENLEEAKAFLKDEYLGGHLLEISEALLKLNGNDATAIMGKPDDLKLKSSMTLFLLADPNQLTFKRVLDKFFGGKMDERTKKMLGLQELQNLKTDTSETDRN